MKKIIAFLLATLMIVAVSACAKQGGKDKDNDQNQNDKTPENIFADVDLQGETYTLMCFTTTEGTAKINSYSDLSADELSGDPVNDAVYERNEKIKSNLNCDLEIYEMGTYGASGTINVGSDLKNILLAGNPDNISAGFVNGISLSALIKGEVLYNLNDIDTLGLDNEWWYKGANDSMTINGKLFAATGDFSVRGLVSMTSIFFNKTLLERYEALENPYDLVRSGKWTIDKLAEYASVMTEIGGDGTLSVDDQVGFVSEWGSSYYYLSAAGIRAYENNGTDVVFAMNNSNAQTMVTKISNLLTNKQVSKIVADHYNDNYSAAGVLSYFGDNKIAFYSHNIYDALELRDMEAEFGMLPLPKLDESQTQYYSISNRYFSSYALIPLASPDAEVAGTLLNALAYYGNMHLREAVYDRSFRSLKLLRDEDSVQMFELIIDTQIQDMGLFFTSTAYSLISGIGKSNPGAFVSNLKKNEPNVNKEIGELLAIYKA